MDFFRFIDGGKPSQKFNESFTLMSFPMVTLMTNRERYFGLKGSAASVGGCSTADMLSIKTSRYMAI